MTFRIETATRGTLRVFILSGRIDTQATAELRRLFEGQTDCRDIALDMKDAGVINRDVMCFLARCEADRIILRNCARYVREWISRSEAKVSR